MSRIYKARYDLLAFDEIHSDDLVAGEVIMQIRWKEDDVIDEKLTSV